MLSRKPEVPRPDGRLSVHRESGRNAASDGVDAWVRVPSPHSGWRCGRICDNQVAFGIDGNTLRSAENGLERITAVADVVGLVDEAGAGANAVVEQVVTAPRPTTVVMIAVGVDLADPVVTGVGDVAVALGIESQRIAVRSGARQRRRYHHR